MSPQTGSKDVHQCWLSSKEAMSITVGQLTSPTVGLLHAMWPWGPHIFSGPSWHSTIKIVLLPLLLGDDSLLAPLAVEVRHKSFIQLTLHCGQMLLLNAVEPVLFVTTADQSSAAMPSYAPDTCPDFTAKPQVTPHQSLSCSLSSIKSK